VRLQEYIVATNFFDDFIAGQQPVARDLTFGGVTKTVHIKQLTASQKLQLDRGQAINVSVGGKKVQADQRMQIDMGDFELKRQLRIVFCVCSEDGKQLFRNINEVQLQPAKLIAALDVLVEEVLGADDLGK
jgi:hypothetical protein